MADVVGVGVEYALGGRDKAHRRGAQDAIGVEDEEAGVGRCERHESEVSCSLCRETISLRGIEDALDWRGVRPRARRPAGAAPEDKCP
jgi:hypothetical protein